MTHPSTLWHAQSSPCLRARSVQLAFLASSWAVLPTQEPPFDGRRAHLPLVSSPVPCRGQKQPALLSPSPLPHACLVWRRYSRLRRATPAPIPWGHRSARPTCVVCSPLLARPNALTPLCTARKPATPSPLPPPSSCRRAACAVAGRIRWTTRDGSGCCVPRTARPSGGLPPLPPPLAFDARMEECVAFDSKGGRDVPRSHVQESTEWRTSMGRVGGVGGIGGSGHDSHAPLAPPTRLELSLSHLHLQLYKVQPSTISPVFKCMILGMRKDLER